MFKRSLTITLLLALIAALVGLNAGSVSAAVASSAATNANLLPADTAIYIDIRTDKITDSLSFIQDTVHTTLGIPAPDYMQLLDQNLSKSLGRPFSFVQDVQPWLGDHISVGVPLADTEIDTVSGPNPPLTVSNLVGQNAIIIVAVKDDAKFDTLIKEVMTTQGAAGNVTSHSDTVNGSPATIYQQSNFCETSCINIVQAKGFFALGRAQSISDMLDTLKAGKPKLGADPKFTKLMTTLSPDSVVSSFISSRFYAAMLSAALTKAATPPLEDLSAPLPAAEATQPADAASASLAGTAEPTPLTPAQLQANIAALRSALGLLDGQAFGLHRDGKLITLDIAQSINMSAMTKFYNDLGAAPSDLTAIQRKPYSGNLFAQIPAKALFVINSSGLNNLDSLLTLTAKATDKFNLTPAPSTPRSKVFGNFQLTSQRLKQLEGGFKLLFGADLQSDFLSWLNGDFALYATFNANSTLAKMPNGKSVPLDIVLIAQTSDTAKTKAFLTDMNKAAKDFLKVDSTPAGTDLYTVTLKNGVQIGYGMVGNTFIISTGTGLNAAVAAIKGDGIISNDPAWKTALSTVVKQPTALVYLNGSQIADALQGVVAQTGMSASARASLLTVLRLFNTTTISAGTTSPDGLNVSSVQLSLR